MNFIGEKCCISVEDGRLILRWSGHTFDYPGVAGGYADLTSILEDIIRRVLKEEKSEE